MASTSGFGPEGNEHCEDSRDIAVDGEYDRPNANASNHIMSTSSRRLRELRYSPNPSLAPKHPSALANAGSRGPQGYSTAVPGAIVTIRPAASFRNCAIEGPMRWSVLVAIDFVEHHLRLIVARRHQLELPGPCFKHQAQSRSAASAALLAHRRSSVGFCRTECCSARRCLRFDKHARK